MHARPIEFRPEAEQEAADAFDWYQQHNPDTAVRFRAELRRIVELIAVMPGAFPPHDGPVCKALLSKFPFLVFFRERESKIEILAVAHTSRRPGYWQDRTDGE